MASKVAAKGGAPLKIGAKRARPAEPVVEWTLQGARCMGLDGVGPSPLAIFAKQANADGDGRDIQIISSEDDHLLAALESLEECQVVWSSRKDAAPSKEQSGPDLAGLQWCLLRFKSAKAATRFLKTAPPSSIADEDAGEAPSSGLQAWLSRATSAPDARALQASVDRYMGFFDAAEEGVSHAQTELEARMEADGFMLVTKKGAKGHAAIPASATGAGLPGTSVVGTIPGLNSTAGGERPISDSQKRKMKRGSLVHADFYKFQALGTKLDALADLRAKFAEDKERLTRLKEGRVFKPY